MAAAFRAGWSNSTPATSLSLTLSTVAHDVLIAWGVTDNTGSAAPTYPASFTSKTTLLTAANDGQFFFNAIKNDASGSEGTVSISQTNNLIGGIVAFSGCDNTTPLDVTQVSGTDVTSATSPSFISLSITPVTNGCAICVIVGGDVNASADVTYSISTTSGTTGAWTTNQDITNGFHNGAVFSCVQTTAGAITVKVICTSAGNLIDRAMTIYALRPAAGAAVSIPNEIYFVRQSITRASSY